MISLGVAWRELLFGACLLGVFFLLITLYALNLPLGVLAGLMALPTLLLAIGTVFQPVRSAIAAVLLAVYAFAPPSIIFDAPVELVGVKLLPAYAVAFVFILYRLAGGTLGRVPRSGLIWCGLLFLLAATQLPILFFYGFSNEVIDSAVKSTGLIAILSLTCCFAVMDWVRRVNPRYAMGVLKLVLVLQLYQLCIFLFNDGVDNILWFGGENRWLRFGQGYVGDLFNPARAYAFVWDPNYLISLTLPLFLIAARAEIGARRIRVEAIFGFSVLLTLSYQSIIIMLMALFLARAGDRSIAWFRKLAFSCALLLPFGCMAVYLLVGADSLPPPEMASTFERIHIIWAVGRALATYPFGIGFGTFEVLAPSEFFAGAMLRTMPPHGWLFELMIGVGLVGYFVLSLYLFHAARKFEKEKGIAFLCFLFWGVTSPAIATPYFWVFFAVLFMGGGKPSTHVDRDRDGFCAVKGTP